MEGGKNPIQAGVESLGQHIEAGTTDPNKQLGPGKLPSKYLDKLAKAILPSFLTDKIPSLSGQGGERIEVEGQTPTIADKLTQIDDLNNLQDPNAVASALQEWLKDPSNVMILNKILQSVQGGGNTEAVISNKPESVPEPVPMPELNVAPFPFGEGTSPNPVPLPNPEVEGNLGSPVPMPDAGVEWDVPRYQEGGTVKNFYESLPTWLDSLMENPIVGGLFGSLLYKGGKNLFDSGSGPVETDKGYLDNPNWDRQPPPEQSPSKKPPNKVLYNALRTLPLKQNR